MNPMNIMKMKGMFEKFNENHPKVPLFFRDAGQCIGEGTVVEIRVTTAEGKSLCTNMKVTAQDMEMIKQLKSQMM